MVIGTGYRFISGWLVMVVLIIKFLTILVHSSMMNRHIVVNKEVSGSSDVFTFYGKESFKIIRQT